MAYPHDNGFAVALQSLHLNFRNFRELRFFLGVAFSGKTGTTEEWQMEEL